MAASHCCFLLLLSTLTVLLTGTQAATLTLLNNCGGAVWPGLMSNAGTSLPSTTGFVLQKGQSESLTMPENWSGRLWARTLCATDAAGKFSCATGDCGSGKVECSGGGATPPATLVEFTLGGMDFYDVSLVDGFNLPVTVAAQGGSAGNCSLAGCGSDMNGLCPAELRVVASEGGVVACRSACDAFGSPEYCCSGAYANPNTCRPSAYSETFKKACPSAYSYAYDDGSSTFTCAGAHGYLITFCPSASSNNLISPRSNNSSPKSDDSSRNTGSRHPGSGMVYLGGDDEGDFMGDSAALSNPSISLPILALALLRSLGCLF